MTKDERFLIELFRASQGTDRVVNPNPIGEKLGYKELLIKNILKGLRQANLIKIHSPEEVELTERGETVARSLLG